VLVCGMKSRELAMLWLQNRDSCWCSHGQGTVGKVGEFTLDLSGLPEGRCRLEWWETWKGNPGRIEATEVRGGRLRLVVQPLASDTAVKIRPLPSP
jgi:hypothetical protein